MNKICAYMPIHYGKDYLEYAIKSIINHVDRLVIFYTNKPSYGYGTNDQCPDAEAELFDIIHNCKVENKLAIIRGAWNNEGEHRQAAEEWAKLNDYDILMACDYDEIWDEGELKKAIDYVKNTNYRNYLVHMRHFWRSFSKVCNDPCLPVRFIKFKGDETGIIPDVTVNHFGYAIPDALMKYKWQIHGHKAELRSDWLENMWDKFPEVLKDLHPTNLNFWNAEDYDKSKLPDLLKIHPFYNLEVIK